MLILHFLERMYLCKDTLTYTEKQIYSIIFPVPFIPLPARSRRRAQDVRITRPFRKN